MQKRENFIPFFLVFFSFSIVLILTGKSGIFTTVSSIFNKTLNPAKATTLNTFGMQSLQNKMVRELSEQNAILRKEVSEKQSLITENKALKDQFAKSSSTSQSLLPAKVVGYPGFIPGVTLPDYLVIDKGSKDEVKIGSPIVVGDYLIGKVVSLTHDFSRIELVNNKNSLFSAKVVPTDGAEISGIVKGRGDALVFDNILLTSNIKKDEMVLTKGGQNEQGRGYPPDLIVGKIVSVEKKSSDLFQKAKVVSFVNFPGLTTVFVLK